MLDAPDKATLTLSGGENFVLKGYRAILECQISSAGNPAAHSIIWTHNGVRIEGAASELLRKEQEEEVLVARFRTAVADITTSGEYACTAVNEVGEGPWAKFMLQVKSKLLLLHLLNCFLFCAIVLSSSKVLARIATKHWCAGKSKHQSNLQD